MTQPDPPPANALPNVDSFFEQKPAIKPLQYSSGELKAFVGQFNDKPLNPKGAELLAELSQLLEDEQWCASHDAAHKALQEALTLADEKTRTFVEPLYKAQMPALSSLGMVIDGKLRETLTPLQEHLEKYSQDNMKWVRCSARNLAPTEGVETITLAKALEQAPARKSSDMLENVTEAAKSATCGEPGHVHGPHCNHGRAPVITPSSSNYSDYSSSYSSTPSEPHVCGTGCSHSSHGASSSSSHSSYEGYSDSGYGNRSAASVETAAAESNWLERTESWVKRQKPENVLMVATTTAAAIGLLYLSGKAEQRRQQERQSTKETWEEKVNHSRTGDVQTAGVVA